MKIIIGLGNPGSRYLFTRHNIGFMVLDAMAHHFNFPEFKKFQDTILTQGQIASEKFLLVKPQSYMNLSGQAIKPVLTYHKIGLSDLLVVQDDVDGPLGQLRFQHNRGHGGHNGIRNIHDELGSPEYARLKLGIGRPPVAQMEVADYVLQNFSSNETDSLSDVIRTSVEAIEYFLLNGFAKAATQYNH